MMDRRPNSNAEKTLWTIALCGAAGLVVAAAWTLARCTVTSLQRVDRRQAEPRVQLPSGGFAWVRTAPPSHPAPAPLNLLLQSPRIASLTPHARGQGDEVRPTLPEQSVAISLPAAPPPPKTERRESYGVMASGKLTAARRPMPVEISAWPALPALLELLQRAPSAALTPQDPYDSIAHWRGETLAELQALRRAGDLHSEASAQIVEHLGVLQQRAVELVRVMPASAERDVCWQAAYGLQRRVDVWSAARQSLGRPELEASARRQTAEALKQLQQRLNAEPEADSWSRYLLVAEVDAALRSASGSHRDVARQALGRIATARRDPALQKWLDQSAFVQWERSLNAWANLPIDVSELLHELEAFEQQGGYEHRRAVADVLDALQWTAAHCRLHETLHAHYRNANLRVGVSDQLLDRFAPPAVRQRQPVQDVILGAAVSGNSMVSATTRFFLTPSRDSWQIGVRAAGEIVSQTRASRGPATTFNTGDATFQAHTGLVIDPSGIRGQAPQVTARASNQLRELQTSMDGVPVVGWLVRQAALHQYGEMRQEAQREAELHISQRIQHEMHAQFEDQTERLRGLYQQRVTQPLDQLRMQPEVLELRTTSTQLIGRFRVVGAGQLGAHTPRPTAPQGSWLELQVHESLANNVLDGLRLDGQRYELRDLLRRLVRWWGHPNWEPDEDIPSDVFVQFADHDAISVELRQDSGRLRLRFARLENANERGFDDFEILVDYRPMASGQRLYLERTDIVRVAGERLGFRDRLPLRGIFSKVFAKNRAVDLLGDRLERESRLEGLVLACCRLDDGWLNLALAPSVELARQSRASTSSASLGSHGRR